MKYTHALIAGLLATTLTLTACSTDNSTSKSATSEQASTSAESATAAAALPTTFTGDDGVDVTVAANNRLLVVDDATIEILHALGMSDNIAVAPKESLVENMLTNVDHRLEGTGSNSMTVEGIAAMNTDLFIGTNMRRQEEIVKDLHKAGIPATLIDATQDPITKVRKTAAAVGATEAGEKVAQQLEAEFEEAKKFTDSIPQAERPRVMVLSSSGAGGKLTGAGPKTAAHQVLEYAGAYNVGAEAGLERYNPITPEGLVAAQPEIIVVSSAEIDKLGGKDGIWQFVPGLEGTPAEQQKRLIILDAMQLEGGLSAGKGALTLQKALFNK